MPNYEAAHLTASVPPRPQIHAVPPDSDDGGTQNANCHPPGESEQCAPGCTHPAGYCNPQAPIDYGWCHCSVGWCKGDEQNRPQPWRPTDLDHMLTQYLGLSNGVRNNNPGYNELVVSSASWTAHLPYSIEAFFVVEGQSDESTVRQHHARFLDTYSLDAAAVPLVKLRLTNWDEPFVDI